MSPPCVNHSTRLCSIVLARERGNRMRKCGQTARGWSRIHADLWSSVSSFSPAGVKEARSKEACFALGQVGDPSVL